MYQPNSSFTSSNSNSYNRNSYGFQESHNNTASNPNIKNLSFKTFQPHNTYQNLDNSTNSKLNNSIKLMENRV